MSEQKESGGGTEFQTWGWSLDCHCQVQDVRSVPHKRGFLFSISTIKFAIRNGNNSVRHLMEKGNIGCFYCYFSCFCFNL